MKPKLIFSSALFMIAAFNANAFKDNDYDISLMERTTRATRWTLDDTSRAIASEVFRQHWNAHLAKIRLQNRQKGIVDEITKWDSENYGETVLKVIPTEIARCFFNITNDMVTYNKFDGRMVECVGTNPSQYTDANWNYVFLINFLDRFLSNTLKPYSKEATKQLLDEVLHETKDTILSANKKGGYMCDYKSYTKKIEDAYSDIQKYVEKLDLVSYLDELRCVRIGAANIKSSIFTDGNKYKEKSVAELKTFISNLDENFGGVDDSKYLSMICQLKGIRKLQLKPKGRNTAYLMVCVDIPDDPESIFKQYRRVLELTKKNGVMKCNDSIETINDISSWKNADLDLGCHRSDFLFDLSGMSVGRIKTDIDVAYVFKEDEILESTLHVIKYFNESDKDLDLLNNVDLQRKIEQCETISDIGGEVIYHRRIAPLECKTEVEETKLALRLQKIDKEINKVSRALNLIPDNKMIDEICEIVKRWVEEGYRLLDNANKSDERLKHTYETIINTLNLNGLGYTADGYNKRCPSEAQTNGEGVDLSCIMNSWLWEEPKI